jgi:hypothetical protein
MERREAYWPHRPSTGRWPRGGTPSTNADLADNERGGKRSLDDVAHGWNDEERLVAHGDAGPMDGTLGEERDDVYT